MKTLAFLVYLLPAILAAADDPQLPPPRKDTLQSVLDRIKVHAAGDAWKQPGFKDDAIEAWLDKLVGSIAKVPGRTDLVLPVRLKDVSPLQGRFLNGSLLIGADILLPTALVRNSVILADGNVRIRSVQNSVIVARGVVECEQANCCVIAAGTLARIGNDGESGNPANGSVVVSRGWAEVFQADGTIIAGRVTNQITGAKSALFVNAPLPQAQGSSRIDAASRTLRVENLPLESLPSHPLAERLRPVAVLHTTQGRLADGRASMRPTAIVVEIAGRRYIADLAQPVVDEANQPAAELNGWKLVCIGEKLAVFSNSSSELGIPL